MFKYSLLFPSIPTSILPVDSSPQSRDSKSSFLHLFVYSSLAEYSTLITILIQRKLVTPQNILTTNRMHYTTSLITVLTVLSTAQAAYVPHAARIHHIRNLSPASHAAGVVRRADGPRPEVSPFLSSAGEPIPGPVYGFPGDLVDPNTPAVPAPSTPQAPAPAPTEPITGFPGDGEAPAPSPEAPSPAPPAPEDPKVEWVTATIDGKVVSWENNYFGDGAAPTPPAGLPNQGTDKNGNEVDVEYAYSTRWSTAVAYVTASP